MTPRTVLITCGGGFQGLALVKALRAVPGTRILILDSFAENITRHFADACFLAPPLKEPEVFLEFILRLCDLESVDCVFAATSLELELLDRHRECFAKRGIAVYVSDIGLIQLAADKLAFYRQLSAAGLRCLPVFDSPLDSDVTFPLIGKPRNGWGGRGIRHLNSREEALALSDEESRLFAWQPMLQDFDEYSVDCAIDLAGRISPLAFRRRIRTLGGFAILCENSAPEIVQTLSHSCVKWLVSMGARGPINFQILLQDLDCWISDLNPRVGTSMPLSLIAGINPIAFLFDQGAAPTRCAGSGPSARSLRYLEERFIPDLRLDRVRAVVFDLDDTLLDQKAWMLAKLELVWLQAKGDLPERHQFIMLALQIIEEGNRAHLFDALGEALGWDSRFLSEMIDCYRSAQPEIAPVYSDVLATLSQLRRLGYRLALLTDNPPKSQRQKLSVCKFDAVLDAVILTGDLGVTKPDIRAFEACSVALGLPPEQMVMVGDNLFRDIHGSLKAGFQHGFLVRRKGAFFNFNPDLAANGDMDLSHCTPVDNLNELLSHLPGIANNAFAPAHSVAQRIE